MNLATIIETFNELVAPDISNEWDVEEILEPLLACAHPVRSAILAQVPVIWPVSHSLCYNFLRLAPRTLHSLTPKQLPPWVIMLLEHYETEGLRSAQHFMENDLEGYLSRQGGGGGIHFCSLSKQLLPYIRGISRKNLELKTASEPYTDSSTIFVPEALDFLGRRGDTFLLYKLILTFQWGLIHCRSFPNSAPSGLAPLKRSPEVLWLQSFFDTFAAPLLARDIYHTLESIRVLAFLDLELPGLMRAVTKRILPKLLPSESSHPLTPLQGSLLSQKGTAIPGLNQEESRHYRQGQALVTDSLHLTTRLSATLSDEFSEYLPLKPLLFQGILNLGAVAKARKILEKQMAEQFVDLMSSHLLTLPAQKRNKTLSHDGAEHSENIPGPGKAESSMVVDIPPGETRDPELPLPLLVTINNEQVPMPEELVELSKNYLDEFGRLPSQYLSAASGKAGQAMLEDAVMTLQNDDSSKVISPDSLLYDEWDYRRQGYRKGWCSLNRKELVPVHSLFIQRTLARYHGLSKRLQHQFEMMHNEERFVRRQREGDDIDFDALVESISDTRAGISSSDRLFIRLKRDRRDIAVLFLVDMSNSTAGWVNLALKESLLLLAEALEVLGDRYGIYGFSGMRRSRCEFFHIKHLEEGYGDSVKERIASIYPSEYTRMGPPIRHCTTLLQSIDAKIRLIITLSDGKPEDYDDYKGKYAIEDTRHALLEAKAKAIHPFCITIDHQARDYLGHMYGPANYIFINAIAQLPARIPEIYRVLTS